MNSEIVGTVDLNEDAYGRPIYQFSNLTIIQKKDKQLAEIEGNRKLFTP